MAAVMDAMVMRAQSCIHDSGYPDAPVAALIKSDVIGAGGRAFFSRPVLHCCISCMCLMISSLCFYSVCYIFPFALKQMTSVDATTFYLTCSLWRQSVRSGLCSTQINVYIYIHIWPCFVHEYVLGRVRFSHSG